MATAILAATSSSSTPRVRSAARATDNHQITVRMPDGSTRGLSVFEAVNLGIVRRNSRGQLVAAADAAARVAALPAIAHSTLPAASGAPAQAKTASELIGPVVSESMFLRSVLATIANKGFPTPFRAYSLVRGIDRHLGGHVLPAALKKGPLADILIMSLIGTATWSAGEALPGALKTARTTYAGARAAGVSTARAGVKALFTSPPKPAEEAAKQAAKAAASLRAPWLKPVASLAGILSNVAFTLGGIADISALFEHTRAHERNGMMRTTEGRGAVLGALSGATTIASLYMPASPMATAIEFVSYAAWLVQLVNDKGWLDGILGSAEPTKKKAPSATQPTAPSTAPTA